MALAHAPAKISGAAIVHIHTASGKSFYRKSLFILLAKWQRRKVVVHIHGGRFLDFVKERRWLGRWLIRTVLCQADVVVLLSRIKRDEFTHFFPRTKTSVIWNPCPTVDVPVRRNRSDRKTVLFAGWIEKEKGIFDLLQAFAVLIKSLPDCRLIIAGKGKIAVGQALAQELGIRDQVDFPGWLDGPDLWRAYGQADVFCLPSYSEGVPMSILEAMSFGLPVLATRVGGVPDLITSGVNGYLVEPGHVDQLSAALARLLRDEQLCASLGARAQVFVRGKCSLPIVSQELDNLYRELLGWQPRPSNLEESAAVCSLKLG